MRRISRRLRLSLVVAATLAGLDAAAPTAGAARGVVGTAHDFSQKAPGRRVCVACHAPHNVPDSRLLWNHELPAGGFQWEGPAQTAGSTPLPTNIKEWSGSSKACLSCHDGTVEVGKTYSAAGSWDETVVSGDARISLGNGHPVAVPYPYGNVKNTYNGVQTGPNVPVDSYNGFPARVKIYADPAGGPNNHGIECGSCHDPHGTPYQAFLRDTIQRSRLCLDCHKK